MPARLSERGKEIFGLALEAPREARENLVRHECGDDDCLCRFILELLRKHDHAGSFLEPIGWSRLSPDPEPASRFPAHPGFQEVRVVGAGGFGTVFEARDLARNQTVAVKVPRHPEAAALWQFKREFREFAGLSHPNLVQLYEMFGEGGNWFFTMEFVRGTGLFDYIRTAPDGEGGSKLRDAFAQLARAIQHLHSHGKLHSDIKPSNVRVSLEGRVKLLDFGLMSDAPGTGALETMTFGGTPPYMAPEARSGRGFASDWYSFGVVLYEALTGTLPFDPGVFGFGEPPRDPVRPPSEIGGNVSQEMDALCMALLDPDPQGRPDGREILEGLAPGSSSPRASWRMGADPDVLIGRDDHLAALTAVAAAVRERGGSACVLVSGESGMGKSALCRSFLARTRADGTVVLQGRCYENESVPFKAMDPVIDALGGFLKRLPAPLAETFLPRAGALQAMAQVFPALCRVEPIERARVRIGAANPRDVRKKAIAGLAETLARISERFPCIVYIDDFQWGDLDSVECLLPLLSPPDPPRVLVILSYRSEHANQAPHLRQLLDRTGGPESGSCTFREITVGRLAPSESRQLIERLAGREPAGADWIERETEGLPLFIQEAAFHLREAQSPAMPMSLCDIVLRRVDALPDPAKRVLQALCLAGKPMAFDAAAEAARVEDSYQPLLAILAAQRLVRSKPGEMSTTVEPYHDKIREAVVSAITPWDKASCFENLAAALEVRGADPESVYQYLLEAGDLSKAATSIELAAERAEAALAFDLAIRLREKRLELRAESGEVRAGLLERLGQSLSHAGQGLRAARAYQSAAGDAAPDRRDDLIMRAAEQYLRSGHFDEGSALATSLLENAGVFVPSQRWQALVVLAVRKVRIRLRGLRFQPRRDVSPDAARKLDICRLASLAMALQNPIRAAELQSRHLLESLDMGEPYRIANSLAMEAGFLAANKGAHGYRAASNLLDKVEDLTSRSDHPNARSLALSVRTKVAWFAGRWDEAARLGQTLNRMAAEEFMRPAWEAYPTSIFWLCALVCMGRWKEVIELLPGLQADSAARGDLLEMASLPVFTFAYIRWLLADQPHQARAELESARLRLSEPGFVPHRFGVCYGLTDVALYTGDSAAARRAVEQGWAELEASMALRIQAVRIFMLHARARVALASAGGAASPRERTRFIEEARGFSRRIRREGTQWGNAITALIDASVAAAAGRLPAVLDRLGAAERAAAAANMQQFSAAARYRIAELISAGPSPQPQVEWFQDQNARNPARLVRILCPGPWDTLARR